jgi:molybdate transport system substrate-binding protein
MRKAFFLALLTMSSVAASAAQINVLSAGAIEPGILAAAAAFNKQSGHQVKVTFATAPALRKRVGGGEAGDVVIAPPAVIDEFAKAGRVNANERANVGRVGVGVAVRRGAPIPDIKTTDGLKRSVSEAESVVFNQASTGIYVEGLMKKLGLYDEIQPKVVRYANGEAVMEHLLKGTKVKEIGFGAITEILLYKGKGLLLVGPLPADVQNYTTYTAVLMTASPNPPIAQEFVRYLATPEAQAMFKANGID